MIGNTLQSLRKSKKISLKKVYESTDISDSRLSKFESGEDILSFTEVIKLIDFYESSLISVLVKSGLVDNNIVSLKNLDKLTSQEVQHIQEEIDFILQIKEVNHGL